MSACGKDNVYLFIKILDSKGSIVYKAIIPNRTADIQKFFTHQMITEYFKL